MVDKPVSISIYIDPATLKKVDSARGDVKRSTFLVKIIREALEQ